MNGLTKTETSMMRFFAGGSGSPRRSSVRRKDDGLSDGSSERPAIGVDQVLAFPEEGAVRARVGATRARSRPMLWMPLGPGWVMRGGLGAGAYAKVFEASWVGTSNKNGGTVPCAIKVMRDVDMESWEIFPEVCQRTVSTEKIERSPGVVSYTVVDTI